MRHLMALIVCLLPLLLVGCQGTGETRDDFRVTCTMHRGTWPCDSATLAVVDDDYGHLRVLCGSLRADSTFKFAGHIDMPQLAMLRFRTDSVPYTFYFILEPTDIHIDIEAHQWLIAGGEKNRAYQLFLNHHSRLLQARDSLWLHYQRLGTQDSTLTWDTERRMLHADSILQDSIQRIVVECINRGDLVGRLVKQRLLPTLTRESLEQLK